MLNRRRLFNVAAVLLFAGFCVGLARLLVLRYSTGDAFPHYSSLRADPLGTKVFYESLRALPDVSVSRNERPLQWLGSGEGTTLFVLGTRPSFVSDAAREAVERFVQSGGRLVLTLYPQFDAPPRKQSSPSPSPTASPTPSPSEQPAPTPAGTALKDVLKRWEIEVKQDRDDKDDVATRKSDIPLEENLEWHSGTALLPQHPDWRVIYDCKRGAVVVERGFDKGSVVLASDSYFVSNEALLANRAPALLAWLSGANRQIVFDESHLDVREQPGVATLLRRYGLSGFVIGFLALIVLWLWRNATFSLAPKRAAVHEDEVVSGRDSFTGFVHLLRRGIAPGQLMDICIAEWRKSGAAADRSKLTSDATAASAPNPVAAYNEISARLASKKWKTTPAN